MSLQDIYKKAGVVMKPAAMKDGKLYSQQPHSGAGDFNFSRADGVQTRINKHGLIEIVANNEPRLSYDLVDGKVSDCPHLLLEPSRTNQFTYSESLNSGWSTGGVVMTLTSSQFISPDGSQNASRLEIPSTGSPSVFAQLESHSSGTQYTVSVYAKSNTGTNQSFRLYGDYGASGNISSDFTATNEWQRFSYTFTASASGSRGAGIYNTTNQSADLQVYGIQFEQGSYPTSYIPTSGSTETRQADICNGSGTSAEFNDSEGVLFAEFSALADDGTTRVITINDTSNQLTERVQLFILSTSMYGRVTDGGVTQGEVSSTPTLTDNNKIAFKYKANDFALWINGVEVDASSSGSTPSGLDTIRFDAGTGGSPFYGKTKQLSTFKTALTDAELEKLTSWESFFDMAKGQEYNVKL